MANGPEGEYTHIPREFDGVLQDLSHTLLTLGRTLDDLSDDELEELLVDPATGQYGWANIRNDFGDDNGPRNAPIEPVNPPRMPELVPA